MPFLNTIVSEDVDLSKDVAESSGLEKLQTTIQSQPSVKNLLSKNGNVHFYEKKSVITHDCSKDGPNVDKHGNNKAPFAEQIVYTNRNDNKCLKC